jgi:hypothetical protein
MITLYQFAKQSNEIEGIKQPSRHKLHAYALKRFLALDEITIQDLEDFVAYIEGPRAHLRTKPEHRVWIGGKEAPSGPRALKALGDLLHHIKIVGPKKVDPWWAHCEYEMIHPFIDGNGRSGRALWLWLMTRCHPEMPAFNFLQYFYYQTLKYFKHKQEIKGGI